MKLIEQEEITSNKRLSSKMDLFSECYSNKNVGPEIILNEDHFYLKAFDRLLSD